MSLPLKKIEFDPANPANFGMFAVSEVDQPAIMENWVFFSKQSKVQLAIQDESQHTVFGPILIPGMEIYRNQGGQEYNLTIDAATIENIVVDFFAKNRANNVNADHQDELVPGFTFFQSIITNDLIPTVKGYEHLPMGTAFFGAKVKDDAKWDEIKAGKYKGWSIHAAFNQVPVTLSESKEIEELMGKLLLHI